MSVSCNVTALRYAVTLQVCTQLKIRKVLVFTRLHDVISQKNVMLTHVRASFACGGPYCNTGQLCGSEHVRTVIRDGVQRFLSSLTVDAKVLWKTKGSVVADADTCCLL